MFVFSKRCFCSRNVGVCLSLFLIGCCGLFSLIFRIVVFCIQFFVLQALSVPLEISVVPLKKEGE